MTTLNTLYEQDFSLWLQSQIMLLEETELPSSIFPSVCPYNEQQLLGKFYPEN
jgi:hypothetical protein